MESTAVFSRVHKAMDEKGETLLRAVRDYGRNDATLSQVQNGTNTVFDLDTASRIAGNYSLDLIVLLDSRGQLVFNYGFTYQDNAFAYLQYERRATLAGADKYGIISLGGTPYMVAMTNVTSTDGTASDSGTLVFGQYVSKAWLERISDELGIRLSVICARQETGNVGAGMLDWAEWQPLANTVPGGAIEVARPEPGTIVTRGPLLDLGGHAIGDLIVSSPRTMILTTLKRMRTNVSPALYGAILLFVVLTYALTKLLLAPIEQLRRELSAIRVSKSLAPVQVKGPPEVRELAQAFNDMAAALEEHETRTRTLEALSNSDTLTGIYRHNYLRERLKDMVGTADPISVLFCDVDMLKNYNSVFGYPEGDKVLRAVAGYARQTAEQRGGFAARYAGDEFAVVLPYTDSYAALILAEQLRKNVEAGLKELAPGAVSPVTLSIGEATYPGHADDSETLLYSAVQALTYAKRRGANQVCQYTPEIDAAVVQDTQERTREEVILNAVRALVAMVDARDTYTGNHSEEVARIAQMLAIRMGLPEETCRRIHLAGLLHDLGKIGVPEDVLNKPGKLSEEDWQVLRTHPGLGERILSYLQALEPVRQWVRFHHERYDGKGYPDGLAGGDIPLGARILAVADSYHAMVSDRPYRNGLPADVVIAELEKNKGIQFDPDVAAAMLDLMRENKV
jgi:diguanylate cyclase (GGDEF)-like protein